MLLCDEHWMPFNNTSPHAQPVSAMCRGISYDKVGDYKAAITDYTAVIELEPANVNAYYSRGFALDNLGQGEKASLDYRRALEMEQLM
jgi:Flp pilus assembly protein TadD